MNVGSLFSGIGGLDLGLHRAGHRHVFFCESDPYRRDVLAARWPGVPIYEDVRLVGEPPSRAAADGRGPFAVEGGRQARTGLLGRGDIGLLCGGFPCQDLSVAGRRAGLGGERSGLFHEFARIADALRPRFVLVENVPGLLSSNGGRDFGVVLGTLADLGYGLAWRILDSRFFGVPQRRRRVFVVGTRADGDPRAAAERAGQILAVGTRCVRHPQTRREAREDATAPLRSSSGRSGGNIYDADAALHYYVEDFEDGTLTSSTGRIDRHPLVAESDIAYALNAKKGYHDGDADTNYALANTGVRRLTPTECERLQALPDGWTQLGDTPDSKRYSALGDAVTANVAEWIGQRLHNKEAVE